MEKPILNKTMIDYLQFIRNKLWLVIVFVLISCISTFCAYKALVTPMYTASSELVINSITKSDEGQIYSDVTMNLNLVETYKEILKSDNIMNAMVAAHPEFKMSASDLKQKLKVSSTDKTQVIKLVVEDSSYAKAANEVNAVVEQFNELIPTLMELDNVKVLNQADASLHPGAINASVKMNVVISFFVSLMIALGTLLFLENINQTLRTEKEVEYYIGLPVITSIATIKKQDLEFNKNKLSKVGDQTHVTVK
ncbi:capsular biosynthesis protein [Paenibacillus psychroresistens]|uniref:Capsular biosynthesis protein n=1 Tax=Paenibacillus psychroresistens TaxID=1778678 RepID=A0A6B8RNF1_9BACL|nr:Wzz/FepE/Etk N-terminal domain-containing protein [Paenibacillus psychroresistens]QGQ97232.1 capsular biosynthesis protein [Paenibacillus psychroresistens]